MTNLVSGGGLGGVLNNVVTGGLFNSVGSFATNIINGGVPALLSNITGGISNTLQQAANGIFSSAGVPAMLNQVSGVMAGGSIQCAAALQGIAQPLQSVTALVGASQASAALLAPIGVAQQVSGAVSSIANNAVQSLNTMATNFSTVSVPQMTSTLQTLNQAVSTAPVMLSINSGTLGAMAKNLTNPQNG